MSDAASAAPIADGSGANDAQSAAAPKSPPKKQQAKKATPAKKTSAAASAKKKTPADHPKYSEMTRLALTSLKERGGSSRQAILKYILKNFKVGNAIGRAH